jgi:hypothetical protein
MVDASCRDGYLKREASRRLAEKKFIVELIARSWAAGIVPGKDFVGSELRQRGCFLLSEELRRC